MDCDGSRRESGLALLARLSAGQHEALLQRLAEVSPALAQFTVAFGYGEVLARPQLDIATRQLCTVAALSAMGNAPAQLRFHIGGALEAGCSATAVIEAQLLCTVYAGFPAAINAVSATRDVLQARGIAEAALPAGLVCQADNRRERGLAALAQVSGPEGASVLAQLDRIAPDLGRFIVEFSYGDVISRPGLDPWTRELISIAMLAALGTAQPQLAVHITAAQRAGASREHIEEVILQIALYAGFPAAMNAAAVAHTALV